MAKITRADLEMGVDLLNYLNATVGIGDSHFEFNVDLGEIQVCEGIGGLPFVIRWQKGMEVTIFRVWEEGGKEKKKSEGKFYIQDQTSIGAKMEELLTEYYDMNHIG